MNLPAFAQGGQLELTRFITGHFRQYPEIGARLTIMRPRSEWRVREDQSLRIARHRTFRSLCETANDQARRPAHALAIDANRYGCNVYADRGPIVCSSPARVTSKLVEDTLLREVCAELLADALLARYRELVRDLVSVIAEGSPRSRARAHLADLVGLVTVGADADVRIGG